MLIASYPHKIHLKKPQSLFTSWGKVNVSIPSHVSAHSDGIAVFLLLLLLRPPPRLSKQAWADWQAPARWRHPFIRALTPVILAPPGRSPWRCQTRELALLHSPGGGAQPWELWSFLFSFIYHLKAAGWDYRPAHLQSKTLWAGEEEEEDSSSRGSRSVTQKNRSIPAHFHQHSEKQSWLQGSESSAKYLSTHERIIKQLKEGFSMQLMMTQCMCVHMSFSKISHKLVDGYQWNLQNIIDQCSPTTPYPVESSRFKMAATAKSS